MATKAWRIEEKPGREQPFVVWRGGKIEYFAKTREEAEQFQREFRG